MVLPKYLRGSRPKDDVSVWTNYPEPYKSASARLRSMPSSVRGGNRWELLEMGSSISAKTPVSRISIMFRCVNNRKDTLPTDPRFSSYPIPWSFLMASCTIIFPIWLRLLQDGAKVVKRLFKWARQLVLHLVSKKERIHILLEMNQRKLEVITKS